ncbi:hypothetical protein [Rickettsiales endosymbiont of Stachyamoeba lipophora]|uniref:hypothetical protein n=1 Tax=Rickettsiales endosymbiont of Stachyamoeba lipophora TaxID=2486578 RepID=UPI000F64DDC8|nr:hypothetical protein [Rickettsiales endosymbiont of Stachyamoeba lipophora]AZL15651.1 hypothetical protein EF513_03690 [Rickettsiales endosymbiont of Stachyamoeba lipophora]
MDNLINELREEHKWDDIRNKVLNYFPHILGIIGAILILVSLINWYLQLREERNEVATQALFEYFTSHDDKALQAVKNSNSTISEFLTLLDNNYNTKPNIKLVTDLANLKDNKIDSKSMFLPLELEKHVVSMVAKGNYKEAKNKIEELLESKEITHSMNQRLIKLSIIINELGNE